MIIAGVHLPQQLMIGAGIIKGEGFHSEKDAVDAVKSGYDIVPGWKEVCDDVGVAEFGSYTRFPMIGNAGKVFRVGKDGTTWNNVGLRNPGAKAAAMYFGKRKDELPNIFGINISPVMQRDNNIDAAIYYTQEAISLFLSHDVVPKWFTLNISCPNTDLISESDLVENLRDLLSACSKVQGMEDIPLWVKIGPDLSDEQHFKVLSACRHVGAKAVIATNTTKNGVGGTRLREKALRVVEKLHADCVVLGWPIYIIASGGIKDEEDFKAYEKVGASAGQYCSAYYK